MSVRQDESDVQLSEKERESIEIKEVDELNEPSTSGYWKRPSDDLEHSASSQESDNEAFEDWVNGILNENSEIETNQNFITHVWDELRSHTFLIRQFVNILTAIFVLITLFIYLLKSMERPQPTKIKIEK